MKVSKYFNIDPNILIEYIYDDSNLIGESYNILFNTLSNTNCFSSGEESRPILKDSKQTNNDLFNQLYKIDNIQNRFGKIPLGNLSNTVNSELTSFLQIKNYSRSIPVRYDTIKVHIPINYVFDDKRGFYLKVYTYNFDNTKIVELSNFFFNITDIDQTYKLEYSSPALIINQKQWGKFIKIQIPSVSQIANQRVLNITKSNTINYNLTNGVGLSTTSPIFLDFHFIDSIDTVGGSDFFNLSSKLTVVTNQLPDFEKIGVKIEESKQGDFIIIYGTYNGNLGDFENYIENAYYEGNRYHVEYQIDTYEKDVRTKTNTIIVNEDFGEEIEYRPILKFTTTTAIIDVILRLVNSVDGSFIERKASYGMLQGGGLKMGVNTGAGDISKYARSLSKINLTGVKKQEVINIKSTILPSVGDNLFGSKPILKLRKLPFNLYSNNYFLIDSNQSNEFNNVSYVANNRSIIYIYPFDNLINLKILKAGSREIPYDLSVLENLKLTIKSDKKDLSFDIYKDSDENDFENGKVVFKISEGSYSDIKKINNDGFDLLYVNGINEDGVKIVVCSAFFLPWDSILNISRIENDFITSLSAPLRPLVKQNQVRTGSGFSGSSFLFKPRWTADPNAIVLGNTKRNYKKVNDTKLLKVLLLNIGFLEKEKIEKSGFLPPIKSSGFSVSQLSNQLKSISNRNDFKLNYLLGYFKGLNIEPSVYEVSAYFKRSELKNDLESYVNVGMLNRKIQKGIGLKESDVTVGEFLPKNKKDFEVIKKMANKVKQVSGFSINNLTNGNK